MKPLLLSLCTAAFYFGFATTSAAQSGNGNFEPQHLADRVSPGDVGAAAPAAGDVLVASRTGSSGWDRTPGSRAGADPNGNSPRGPQSPAPASPSRLSPPRTIRRAAGN